MNKDLSITIHLSFNVDCYNSPKIFLVAIISSKYQSGRVVDQLGNGAYIYADNDPNGEYFEFGFNEGRNL